MINIKWQTYFLSKTSPTPSNAESGALKKKQKKTRLPLKGKGKIRKEIDIRVFISV